MLASNLTVPWQAGVMTILAQRYPSLFTWQNSNYKLELAFGEVVSEIDCMSHFGISID